MKFEEYLKVVIEKIGPNSVFGLARDSRHKALIDLLIEKEVFTKEELEAAEGVALGDSAEQVSKMPSLQKNDEKKQENTN